MSSFAPLVLVEVVLVLGGAIAFAWWQLRDVERAQREARERRAREAAAEATGNAAAASGSDPGEGSDRGGDAGKATPPR